MYLKRQAPNRTFMKKGLYQPGFALQRHRVNDIKMRPAACLINHVSVNRHNV